MRIRRIIPLCLISAALCLSCSKKKEEAPKEAENAVEAESRQPSPSANADENAAKDKKEGSDSDALEAGVAQAEQAAPQKVRSTRKPMWHAYTPIQAREPGLSKNPILKTIPNSSFLIVASTGEFEYQRKDFDDFLNHISTLVMAQLKQIPETEAPFIKSVHAMFRGLFRNLSSSKLASLGLSGETLGHFAFYFVRQTPVLKITLTDSDKFQGIIESYWKQNNIELHTPTDLTTAWSLIRIDENDSAALAMHWESDTLTITIVSDDEHAGKLLPDLSTVPPEDKSAITELSSISVSNSAYIVGLLDMNAMLNQFVQIQEQVKKFAGDTPKEEIDKRCIKDMHRIASVIPRIVLQVMPVSGGSTLGMDAKFSFEFQNDAWLHEMLSQTPHVAKFPKYEVMPLANFWITLPVKQLMSISAMYRDAVKLEPFSCPWLINLNDIETDAIGEMTSIPQFALHTHYVGAVLYEGTVDHPRKYAASYQSEKAAEMASLMHIIQSDKLLKRMGLSEEEPAQPPEKEADTNDIPGDPKEADAAEAIPEPPQIEPAKQPEGPVIYDDAKIALDGAPKGMLHQITDGSIVFASDERFLTEMTSEPLKTANSFVHFEMSERLLEEQDADPDRDFHLGLDVTLTPRSVDATLRYALE